MATKAIATSAELDILNKYNSLVKEALGPDGAYIRAKETMEEMFERCEIDNGDRADVISNVLSNIATGITTGAMSAALTWETTQKELGLKREQLAYELEILEQQGLKAAVDVGSATAAKQAMQAKTIREYGSVTSDVDGNVTGLTESGIAYQSIEGLKQDNLNKVKQGAQLDAAVDQTNANIHKLVADTYVNHGLFTGYTITDTGIASATKVDMGAYKTLSEYNQEVATEQAKGYAYNAWSNAASSSASMLGTMLAAEITPPDATDTSSAWYGYFSPWKEAVDKLKNVTASS